jgi:hypothetical protein
MKQILLIPFFLLTLISCRKDKPLFNGQTCDGDCYILSGKLIEAQTNAPLSNIQLKFYYRPSGYFIFYNPTKYLGNTVTSLDGNYNFKFNSKKFKNPTGYFYIKGEKDGYIDKNNGTEAGNLALFDLDSTKVNVPQLFNLKLFKASILKIKVKAVNNTNYSFLTINYNYGTNGYGPALNGGRPIDTTFVFKTASDIPTYIHWYAMGNGINIEKRDTLTVPSGTEKTYEINL